MVRWRQGSQAPERKTPRRSGILGGVFLLVGLGLLGGAGYLFVDTRRAVATGVRAEGTVIDLIAERDSDGGNVYYPRVRFVTPDGNAVEFTGSVGSSPAAFDVGEAVAVIYSASDPQKARIDSFFQLWFGPLIMGFLGLVFTAVGGGASLTVARSGRRRSAPMPAPPSATPIAGRSSPTVERAPRD